MNKLENAATQISQAMYQELLADGGEVEVDIFENSVEIIKIIAGIEGRGSGTRAMKVACDLADKLNIQLILTPDGSYYEDEIRAQKRLRIFYARFGFISENNKMVRLPN